MSDPVSGRPVVDEWSWEDIQGLMGEVPSLDPFVDDSPLVCGPDEPVVCESCQ